MGSKGALSVAPDPAGKWYKVSEKDLDKPSKAHYAAEAGKVRDFERFSAENPNLLFQLDPDGLLPLHIAAKKGHLNMVKLLMLYKEGQAQMNVRTNFGKGETPLWHARSSLGRSHPVVDYLESIGALSLPLDPSESKVTESSRKNNEAHTAADSGDLKKLKQIAKASRSDLHAKDENGWMPLHEAARSGNYEVVMFLIEQHEKGADIVNERANFGKGASILWLAQNSRRVNPRLVKFLKSIGGKSLQGVHK